MQFLQLQVWNLIKEQKLQCRRSYTIHYTQTTYSLPRHLKKKFTGDRKSADTLMKIWKMLSLKTIANILKYHIQVAFSHLCHDFLKSSIPILAEFQLFNQPGLKRRGRLKFRSFVTIIDILHFIVASLSLYVLYIYARVIEKNSSIFLPLPQCLSI